MKLPCSVQECDQVNPQRSPTLHLAVCGAAIILILVFGLWLAPAASAQDAGAPLALPNTYRSPDADYVLKYPRGWSVEEESATMTVFISPGDLALFSVTYQGDLGFQAANITLDQASLYTMAYTYALSALDACTNEPEVRYGELIIGAVEWASLEFDCEFQESAGVAMRIAYYFALHPEEDAAYLAIAATLSPLFPTQRPVFDAMVASITFATAAVEPRVDATATAIVPTPAPKASPATVRISGKVPATEVGTLFVEVVAGEYRFENGVTAETGSKMYLRSDEIAYPAGLLIDIGAGGATLLGQSYAEGARLQVADDGALRVVTVAPGSTALPAATATPEPTPAVSVPQAIVVVNSLNLRDGPGTNYKILGSVSADDVLTVTGQANNCAWLQVVTPAAAQGWVSGAAQFVTLAAPCMEIPPGHIRPATGIIKRSKAAYGAGELVVANGADADGLIVLTTLDDQPLIAGYVRQDESVRMTDIPDGEYRIFFSKGEQWDDAARQFTGNGVTYKRFDDTFLFTTTWNQYTYWEVTLYGVAGGNAPSVTVPPAGFPQVE